jgi:hypothetical protein
MTQPSLAELLARLKGGVAVPIPEGGKNPEAYLEPIFTPGRTAEVTEEQYFYWLEILPPRWMKGSHFCFAEGEAPFCLFWYDREAQRYFARQLSSRETLHFCALTGVPPPLVTASDDELLDQDP